MPNEPRPIELIPGGPLISVPFEPPPMRLTPAFCDLCKVNTFAEIMAYHSKRHVAKLMTLKRRAERRYEYRLRWRREEGGWHNAVFATLQAALRKKDQLTAPDADHWLCDHESDVDPRCLSPIKVKPFIQRRLVGLWEDHGHHGFLSRAEEADAMLAAAQ